MTLELSRRTLLKQGALAALAAPFFTVRANAEDVTVIDIVTDGDTNISDWWTNVLAPKFEAANPASSSMS